MISVANWEGVSTNANAVGAMGQALSAPRPDACAVLHREVLGEAHFSDASAVRFSAASILTTTYINVSSTAAINSVGNLANVDVVNGVLDPATITHVFPTTGPKKVWIQLATDGCSRNGSGQRMLSRTYELDVGGGTAPIASSPIHLFADTDHRIATLSWDDTTTASLTLDFAVNANFAGSTSVSFKDAHAFYTDGFKSAFPLYVRLHAGSAVSNTIQLK